MRLFGFKAESTVCGKAWVEKIRFWPKAQMAVQGGGTLLPAPSSAETFKYLSAEDILALDGESFLRAVYWACLNREPDTNGARTYTRKLHDGYGRLAVLNEIINSDEAKSKNMPRPARLDEIIANGGVHRHLLSELLSLNNEAFLRSAYRILLCREIDSTGFASYLNRLQTSGDRISILVEIRSSSEGKRSKITIPGLEEKARRQRRQNLPVIKTVFRRLDLHRQLEATVRRVNEKVTHLDGTVFGLGGGAAAIPRSRANEPVRLPLATLKTPGGNQPSEPVFGNVALPARVMNEGVTIRRIAVLKLDHFGDLFVAIRAMVRLREVWPQAWITLVCGPWNVKMAKRLGIFDQVVAYQFFPPKSGDERFSWEEDEWRDRCDGIRDLNLGVFDLAIDLRHDADTRPCLLRLDAKYRVGFAGPGLPLSKTPPLDLSLQEILPQYEDQLHAEARLMALVSLTVETFLPVTPHPIHRLISDPGKPLPFDGQPYVVLAPNAGSPNRTWDPDNFVQLALRMNAEFGFKIILIGPPGEKEGNAAMAAKLPASACQDRTGEDFANLPWLLSKSALYIGNDTGGSHLSAMLGIPTLCIYGGVSDPRVWQPLGPKVSIVHSKTPCSYCHINTRVDCHHDVRCMAEITVDDAYTQLKLLVTTPSQAR